MTRTVLWLTRRARATPHCLVKRWRFGVLTQGSLTGVKGRDKERDGRLAARHRAWYTRSISTGWWASGLCSGVNSGSQAPSHLWASTNHA